MHRHTRTHPISISTSYPPQPQPRLVTVSTGTERCQPLPIALCPPNLEAGRSFVICPHSTAPISHHHPLPNTFASLQLFRSRRHHRRFRLADCCALLDGFLFLDSVETRPTSLTNFGRSTPDSPTPRRFEEQQSHEVATSRPSSRCIRTRTLSWAVAIANGQAPSNMATPSTAWPAASSRVRSRRNRRASASNSHCSSNTPDTPWQARTLSSSNSSLCNSSTPGFLASSNKEASLVRRPCLRCLNSISSSSSNSSNSNLNNSRNSLSKASRHRSKRVSRPRLSPRAARVSPRRQSSRSLPASRRWLRPSRLAEPRSLKVAGRRSRTRSPTLGCLSSPRMTSRASRLSSSLPWAMKRQCLVRKRETCSCAPNLTAIHCRKSGKHISPLFRRNRGPRANDRIQDSGRYHTRWTTLLPRVRTRHVPVQLEAHRKGPPIISPRQY